MVLSIKTGENIDDKIHQFIQKHDLGMGLFEPILQHVLQLLDDGTTVSTPKSAGPMQRSLKSSPKETISRDNRSSKEGERIHNYHNSLSGDYGQNLNYSPIEERTRRLPSEEEEEEEHIYDRARSQYDDQENWPTDSQLQPTYNEINMSSNNSLSGNERGRRSRSSSHDVTRTRPRSISPSSLGGLRRQDTFERLFKDGERFQKRKKEMGLRLDEQIWKDIGKASYRKQLGNSPTRHFRFDADRERMFRNSGLTLGEFIFDDHQKWLKNRDVRIKRIKEERERKLQLELETMFKPNLETSAAMQLPNTTSTEAIVNRLHNAHYFYEQNRTVRNDHYENQYKELVGYHQPSINPYSRKLAAVRAARKTQLRQQQEASQGPTPTENRQPEPAFFTPVAQQPQPRNATESSNQKFPSQLKSHVAPRMVGQEDVAEQNDYLCNDVFEMSLRLQDLQVADTLEHSSLDNSSADSTTDNNPAALNMELLARLKDADTNTDSGATTAQLNHNASANASHTNTTSIRPTSKTSSPLRINTEAPRLNATSVDAHVAHTPMNIAPILTESVDHADKQLHHVRSFSHASVGSGTAYELKSLNEIRAVSPFIFRDSKDLLISASSANPPTPVSVSSRFFVGTASSNNSMVSGLATSPSYRLRNNSSSPSHVRTSSAASVLSNMTALRRAQQTNSSFHHYAAHAPVLPVHERLIQEGIDIENHKKQLKELLTPQFSFTPSTGRAPNATGTLSKTSTESCPTALDGQDESNNNNDSTTDLNPRAPATNATKKNVFDRLWEKRREGNCSNSDGNGSSQIPSNYGHGAPNILVGKLLTNSLTEAEAQGVVNRLVGYSKAHDDLMEAQRKKQDDIWTKITKGNALSIPKSEKMVRDRQRATLKELFLVLCVSVNYHRAKNEHAKLTQESVTTIKRQPGSGIELEAETRAEVGAVTAATVAEDEESQLPFRSALLPLDACVQDEEKQQRDLERESEREFEREEQPESEAAWVGMKTEEAVEIAQVNTVNKLQSNTDTLVVPAKEETLRLSHSHEQESLRSQQADETDEDIQRSTNEKRLNIFLADPTHLKYKELIDAMLYILATFRKEYHQWIQQSALLPLTSEENKRTDSSNAPQLDAEKTFTLLYISEQAFVSRGMKLLQTNVFLPGVASLLAVPPRSKSPAPTEHTGKPVLKAEKKTNQLIQERYRDRKSGRTKIEDSLLAYREQYEQNLEDLRRVVEVGSSKELTFAPSLISVYERERRAQKALSNAANSAEFIPSLHHHYQQQQEQQQFSHRDNLHESKDQLSANIMGEQSILNRPTSFLSNLSQPRRLPESNHQAAAQQPQAHNHRWTSAHWKQQILLHQEQRKSIEQTPSFLSSPK
jgi:hypothetical protein